MLLLLFCLLYINCIIGLPLNKEKEYEIEIDRLSELISTHLKFDHFDLIKNKIDKFIAIEFQHHIQINIELKEELPTLDMMDLEILKSQIFAAIQAHTEGNLPLIWNTLDHNLERQSIELFLHEILYDKCGQNDLISSTCLKENSINLSNTLDLYINQNLNDIFNQLDIKILPTLLEHISKDLKNIIHYFNSVFLKDQNKQFVLHLIPWNTDPNDIHNFKSKLLDLAFIPSLSNNQDIHSFSFFIEFASMATV